MPTRPVRTLPRAVVIPLPDDILREDSVPPRLAALAVTSGAPAVHLDLAAVDAPTAGGLGKLVALARELRAAGVGLVLLNVRPEVEHVFAATGLNKLFEVRPVQVAGSCRR